MVSYLTNSIVDQILQELYATHKTLVNIHRLSYSAASRTRTEAFWGGGGRGTSSQTRQVSHLKPWEGTLEEDTGWRLNRHRDSLDITDEELSTSIVSLPHKATPPFWGV